MCGHKKSINQLSLWHLVLDCIKEKFIVRFVIVVFMAFGWLTASASAAPKKRTIIIISNGAHQHLLPLRNPKNDADAVERAFKRVKFKTVRLKDLTRAQTVAALQKFIAGISDDHDVVAMYYAGHGALFEEIRYIIPVDARVPPDEVSKAPDPNSQFSDQLVSITEIMKAFAKVPAVKLILIEACQDTPAGFFRPSGGTEPNRFGLDELPPDMLIQFSSNPGTTALDGLGKHSPYAEAVLTAFKKNLDIGLWNKFILHETVQRAQHSHNVFQAPWSVSTLRG
jgi:hypothetical protein